MLGTVPTQSSKWSQLPKNLQSKLTRQAKGGRMGLIHKQRKHSDGGKRYVSCRVFLVVRWVWLGGDYLLLLYGKRGD